MQPYYQNKIVTVTGGSSGIGRELVRLLSEQGAIVIIGARSASPAETLIQEQSRRGAISYMPLDVQKPKDCERFFADVMHKHGQLDYAFNSAGIIMGGEFRDQTIENIQSVITTNVLGTTYCSFYAYGIMKQQGHGHIVNFSSGAGIVPLPLMGVYSSSKFAVFGLSEAMRIEGRDVGVRVSVVTPGLVDTPMYVSGIYSGTDKNSASKILRNKTYTIQPDVAARKILRGVEHNRAIIGTQWYIRTAWLSYRLFPWAYRAAAYRLMPIFRKKYRNPSEATVV